MNHVEGFTPRKIGKFKAERKVYHNLNTPSIVRLKVWVYQNMAKNLPISFEDVDLSEKFSKADVPTCKGNSTSPCPQVVYTGPRPTRALSKIRR